MIYRQREAEAASAGWKRVPAAQAGQTASFQAKAGTPATQQHPPTQAWLFCLPAGVPVNLPTSHQAGKPGSIGPHRGSFPRAPRPPAPGASLVLLGPHLTQFCVQTLASSARGEWRWLELRPVARASLWKLDRVLRVQARAQQGRVITSHSLILLFGLHVTDSQKRQLLLWARPRLGTWP